MAPSTHPAAAHSLPAFIAGPGESDLLMTVAAVILIASVIAVGVLFLRLHSLPERIAHRGHKLQFEIVAVLGLIALFTHIHLFWVAALILALVDFPEFGNPLGRIAKALERMSGQSPDPGPTADLNSDAFSSGVRGAAAPPAGADIVAPSQSPDTAPVTKQLPVPPAASKHESLADA
jgi:multisubunit Na+/H+ antiporter MnhF subunit